MASHSSLQNQSVYDLLILSVDKLSYVIQTLVNASCTNSDMSNDNHVRIIEIVD